MYERRDHAGAVVPAGLLHQCVQQQGQTSFDAVHELQDVLADALEGFVEDVVRAVCVDVACVC